MRIGPNCGQITIFSDQTIGCANKFVSQPFRHGLHGPILPQKRMAPARAKIRKAQVINIAQDLYFFPELGHGAGIENLNLKPAHIS